MVIGYSSNRRPIQSLCHIFMFGGSWRETIYFKWLPLRYKTGFVWLLQALCWFLSLWSLLFVSDTKSLHFGFCVLVFWPCKTSTLSLLKHDVSMLHAGRRGLGEVFCTYLSKHLSCLCWVIMPKIWAAIYLVRTGRSGIQFCLLPVSLSPFPFSWRSKLEKL